MEWMDITAMGELEVFTDLQCLYLQYNKISVIEGLTANLNLEFLALQGNQISKIENLKHLEQLKFLDLSKNKIESVDIEEIPTNLLVLRLDSNPCCESTEDYRKSIVSALPQLEELDRLSVF